MANMSKGHSQDKVSHNTRTDFKSSRSLSGGATIHGQMGLHKHEHLKTSDKLNTDVTLCYGLRSGGQQRQLDYISMALSKDAPHEESCQHK